MANFGGASQNLQKSKVRAGGETHRNNNNNNNNDDQPTTNEPRDQQRRRTRSNEKHTTCPSQLFTADPTPPYSNKQTNKQTKWCSRSEFAFQCGPTLLGYQCDPVHRSIIAIDGTIRVALIGMTGSTFVSVDFPLRIVGTLPFPLSIYPFDSSTHYCVPSDGTTVLTLPKQQRNG